MPSPAQEIKDRLDITQVVGSYVTLQKVGANYRAPCPFHSEKSPSFFVSPARQTWHCFGGCQTGGDIFRFIMDIEGVEFRDALAMLADRAGVELPRWSREESEAQSARKRLAELLEDATRFFERQMESSLGGQVASYLKERGVSGESIKEWRVGWAPEGARALSDFLRTKGYEDGEIEKAGLSLMTERGRRDRFAGRIIFPIADLNGQVIGFGGRVFRETDKAAKYVNTPATPLYDKSGVLYGLDKAKLSVRKEDSVLLVEGYLDVILSRQAGFENVAASSGTALTSQQLRVLKRYTSRLTTAFDMDPAGDHATKRGIELALQEGFEVKVVVMPEGKDPADVAAQDASGFKRLVEEAGSVLDFYIASALSRHDALTPEGKRNITEEVLPVVASLPNKVEQFHWVQVLADRLGTQESVVAEELGRYKKGEAKPAPVPREKKVQRKPRQELLEDQLLKCVFQQPSLLSEITEEHCSAMTEQGRELFDALRGLPSLEQEQLEQLGEGGAERCRGPALLAETEAAEEGEFAACLRELKALYVRRRLDGLSSQIKEAEAAADAVKIQKLIREFHETSKEL